MSHTIVGVLVVLGLTYVAFAFAVMSRFVSYCDRLAKATGRERERENIWSADEGGLNAFDLEQFRKLRRGDYLELTDPGIATVGKGLTRLIRLLYLLGAVLLVIVVAANAYASR